MFSEAVKKICSNARAKSDMSKNSVIKYLILSVMAGFYIGIAMFLVCSIGAPLSAAGSPVAKPIMGLAFSVGLTLVVFAGSELFSGNVLFIGVGLAKKAIKPLGALRVLGLSFLGNLAGSLIFTFIIYYSGLLNGTTSEFIISTAAAKINLSAAELITRGMLCNMLVCLALWMGVRAGEEISKIIFIALCLFAFVASGYEHCVADMTHLAMALLSDGGGMINLGGYAYALLFATVGNILGGALIAVAYTYTGNN